MNPGVEIARLHVKPQLSPILYVIDLPSPFLKSFCFQYPFNTGDPNGVYNTGKSADNAAVMDVELLGAWNGILSACRLIDMH